MPDVDTEAESMPNQCRGSAISTKGTGPEWDALHDAFFSQGDEGTYEGGPARIAASRELAASLEEDARRDLARTPEQDVRRARATRFVALFFGMQLLILGIAAMRNQHRAFAEGVEDGAATDHGAPPAPVRGAVTRRKPAATPMPAVSAGIEVPGVVDAESARARAPRLVSAAGSRCASRSQKLRLNVGAAGAERSAATTPTNLTAAKPPGPSSKYGGTDPALLSNPSSAGSTQPPPADPQISANPAPPPVVRAASIAAFEPI